LASSNQFERCEQVANTVLPVYFALEEYIANSELLQQDDTGVRILELMKENKQLTENDRKGMYTTGITGVNQDYTAVLYKSSRRYSSENMAILLKKREMDAQLPKIMGDASHMNWSEDFKGVIGKCLAHGRRQFVDIEQAFPLEAHKVIIDIGQVYKNEANTRDMSPGERLAYHQEHSKPIMDDLKKWIEEKLEKREVEPSSSLGKAFKYFLKHFDFMTSFLRVEGMPLDNNLCERILRKAVLSRKNSLFYKTSHGAAIGDVLMSLIESCRINQINPYDYLLTLLKNAANLRASPADWLPWNYHQQKAA
jgi:hypothetical protein